MKWSSLPKNFIKKRNVQEPSEIYIYKSVAAGLGFHMKIYGVSDGSVNSVSNGSGNCVSNGSGICN